MNRDSHAPYCILQSTDSTERAISPFSPFSPFPPFCCGQPNTGASVVLLWHLAPAVGWSAQASWGHAKGESAALPGACLYPPLPFPFPHDAQPQGLSCPAILPPCSCPLHFCTSKQHYNQALSWPLLLVTERSLSSTVLATAAFFPTTITDSIDFDSNAFTKGRRST
jgi:hypothetical protein